MSNNKYVSASLLDVLKSESIGMFSSSSVFSRVKVNCDSPGLGEC